MCFTTKQFGHCGTEDEKYDFVLASNKGEFRFDQIKE